jgi:hypothetical protein
MPDRFRVAAAITAVLLPVATIAAIALLWRQILGGFRAEARRHRTANEALLGALPPVACPTCGGPNAIDPRTPAHACEQCRSRFVLDATARKLALVALVRRYRDVLVDEHRRTTRMVHGSSSREYAAAMNHPPEFAMGEIPGWVLRLERDARRGDL